MKPLSGQANFVEKIIFSSLRNFFGRVSFSYSTKSNPFAMFTDVSTASASLLPIEELITILSTKIEISCLNFLFRSGAFSISYNILFILIFLKPLFFIINYFFFVFTLSSPYNWCVYINSALFW